MFDKVRTVNDSRYMETKQPDKEQSNMTKTTRMVEVYAAIDPVTCRDGKMRYKAILISKHGYTNMYVSKTCENRKAAAQLAARYLRRNRDRLSLTGYAPDDLKEAIQSERDTWLAMNPF